MTLIGMLHHRRDPETVVKSYAYAAVAKAEGVQFFYFSPGKVDFKTRTILGKVLENGQWQERAMPFPDVIYNAGSPERLAIAKTTISKLREEIPFTTNSIGNKWNVTKRIREAKEFAQYLIPTEIAKSLGAVENAIETYKKIVFKPTDGRKGKGIYVISAKDEGYDVLKDTKVTYYTKPQFHRFLRQQLAEGRFIIQPYIQSVMKSGQVFDFRLHVQKNGEGKWCVTTVYPRVAPIGSIIPNINNGGFTNYIEPFLAQEFPEQAFDIQRMIEHFALALARHLDDIQMTTFDEVIDEIGIDIGLDEQQKIWVYEVNWRPGCPPAFYLELDVVKNGILYAKYLAEHQQQIKQQIQEAKNRQLEAKKKPIIAITGSAGKTTTKAFIASILAKRWSIFESKDYWNTTEHTARHAQMIEDSHQAVVLEYGMAYAGVIAQHCEIIQPNISVVTNVGLAHVGNFEGDIKGVAGAKSELIHGMDPQGLLILNQDDSNTSLLTMGKFAGTIKTIGIEQQADYQAYDVTYEKEGMSFKVKLQQQELQAFIPILGEHHVYNALNAIAVADQLGFTLAEIRAGLLFKKPPRRLTLYQCKDDITLIDDTVHSHPQGARAAIDVLCSIAKNRKIAIIGQMRELGDLREEEYRKLGAYIQQQGIDVLVTYGFRTEDICEGAIASGMPSHSVHHFINKEKLHLFLKELVGKDDTILVKGASKTNMFETIQFLEQQFK